MNKPTGYIIVVILTALLAWGVYDNFIKGPDTQSDTVSKSPDTANQATVQNPDQPSSENGKPEVAPDENNKQDTKPDQPEKTDVEKENRQDRRHGDRRPPQTDSGDKPAPPDTNDKTPSPNSDPAQANQEKDPNAVSGKEQETKQDSEADQADSKTKAESDQQEKNQADTETPPDPDPIIKINLNGVEVKNLIGQLSEWTGKVIIPDQNVMGQKLIIYSKNEMPRSKALDLIYTGLREKGYVIEETEDVLYIKPIKDALLGHIPTIPDNQPLAAIANQNQVVQKFFKMKNYSPTQMQQILLPLIPEYGYVSADESTGNLVIIDTVSNLLRLQRIIEEMDIPEYEPTVTETFILQKSDPAEVVQLLKILLGDQRRSYNGDRNSSGNRGGNTAQTVQISKNQMPVVLIPEPKRKWIIARGSNDDIQQIAKWIEKLDLEQPEHREYSLKKIEYADVNEVARQISNMVRQMPGQEIRANILVQPMIQTNQIMIVGSKENRDMIEKLIEEVDIPTDKVITAHFKLKYADPEQLKEYIDELFSQQGSSSRRNYYDYDYYYYDRYRRGGASDETVKTIAYPTLKQITVIATPETMEKVRKQIEEWDQPIDPNEVQPLIVELKNSDPVKMSTLLSDLFSESSGRDNELFDYIFGYGYGRGSQQSRKKIVGPLYGQLTFKPVPDTKKIIVISKIPEAYEVVETLIRKLDRQEPAELPMIIEVKYADCEDLSEQLNAIFSETGPAEIRRSKRGLSNYEAATVSNSNNNQNNQNANRNNDNNQTSPGMMRFNWGRPQQDQMPTSNLLGKIRFMPVYRSKSIMVLSPLEYQESIQAMIRELDQPARQVMIKAIIVMVNRDNMTSLGTKIATDPAALGATSENALIALSKLVNAEQPGSSLTIDNSLEVNTLLDLLVKEARAQVLNQPTLWTKDNEQAEFFKGRNVAFKALSITSAEGGSTRDSVQYNPVGLTLRVRPNITPEDAVDMEIFLNISQVEPELVSGNIATSDFKTTTYMIVDNGQTLLLSGYLFKDESETVTKIPLLGDIPLLGELFKHRSIKDSNIELLAFITPYVIDNKGGISQTSLDEIENAKNKMKSIKDDLTNNP